ncbi:MAG: hypothetical protein ACE5IE_03965 [Dehalococcoidia bacterium]
MLRDRIIELRRDMA